VDHRDRITRTGFAALVVLLLCAAIPAGAAAAPAPTSVARSAGAWRDVAGRPAPVRAGAKPDISPRRFRALDLDHAAISAVLDTAPRGRSAAARATPLIVSLPAPDGTDRRFAVAQSSIMEPALAAAHPEIATYSGTGIDDVGATVHIDVTPLGLHASVRGPGGTWYVDPYYHGERSLYASYDRADLVANPHGRLVEPTVAIPRTDRVQFGLVAPSLAGAPVQLRTYRLALLSDPAYALFHGAANVTAAKVALVDRVNQIYEDDLAIHLTLVANNDVLNLDTAAQMTGADGPCGAAACYTTAQAGGCTVATLDRTRIVLGQLIGASNYDIGHIGMGVNGGGVAYLGVVGDDLKGGGCTGVNQPVGDLFAVDYVAHEMGHQFGGDHPFNGVTASCSAGNREPTTSVEPGSGSTVMAYAGICGTDDLQPHSDPYFSQRSIDEISTYVASGPFSNSEVQTVSLSAFGGTDSFRLTYNGVESALVTRGTNYTAAGISAALKTIPALAGATFTIGPWAGGTGAPDDTGFSVRFGGTLSAVDASPLTVTSGAGVTGFAGETTRGGPARNGGTVTPTADSAPVVTAPAAFTIPARTPFSLTGSGTDADGDPLVYLWEQNDPGAATGTSLVSNAKSDGPLFRVFGTAAQVSAAGTITTPSPGENSAGTSPTRVFPDMTQILAGNTNAATGACPTAGAAPVLAAIVDCYSEFLPTSAYTGTLHFRLTARDTKAGAGGVAHADTTLTLARTAGPFRVTSQAAATTVDAGTQLPVTWSVNATNAAPIDAANVRITLSTDGGQTFPQVLSASTPNDGTQSVLLPNVGTTQARIRVEAVGNVFFDVSHASFTIVSGAPVVSSDAPASPVAAQYSDAAAPVVTVSATDENSAGTALSASATGLPAGLQVTPATTPAPGTPGSRTWTVGGTVTGAPGTYPATVTVSDGAGHVGVTSFDVVVTPEDALATYAGDATVTGAAGAATAPATLRFTVHDAAADGSPGDVAGATVTFTEGATTLCSAVAVVTAGDPTTGTATCTPALSTGTTHHLTGTIGARYTGTGAGDVDVVATPAGAPDPAPPAPPAPPTPPAPTPPVAPATPAPAAPVVLPSPLAVTLPPSLTAVAPAAALLAPDLGRVAARLKLTRTGRTSLTLRCGTLGDGPAATTCSGTLTLTARLKGRVQPIATARFAFARTAAKTVTLKLTAKARAALRKATRATLTATVANPGAAARTATKRVTLVPPAR
jgi:hypothetical protein